MGIRTIIFRGKRTDNGEWIEGYFASQSNHACFANELKHQHFIFKDVCLDFNLGGLQEFEVIPETIGQYTGLTDKNGKKIFEGDIIDTPDRLVKVVWFAGNAQFDLHFIRYKDDVTTTNFKGIYMRDLKEYEVIGNIHDNPELLEG